MTTAAVTTTTGKPQTKSSSGPKGSRPPRAEPEQINDDDGNHSGYKRLAAVTDVPRSRISHETGGGREVADTQPGASSSLRVRSAVTGKSTM